MFVDTRIERTTELILFLSRLYTRLEVQNATRVLLTVTYRGLAGRRLAAADPRRMVMIQPRTSQENQVSTSVGCTVAELQSRLPNLVRELLEPVFVLFDFFVPGDNLWEQIIDNFVARRGN